MSEPQLAVSCLHSGGRVLARRGSSLLFGGVWPSASACSTAYWHNVLAGTCWSNALLTDCFLFCCAAWRRVSSSESEGEGGKRRKRRGSAPASGSEAEGGGEEAAGSSSGSDEESGSEDEEAGGSEAESDESLESGELRH